MQRTLRIVVLLSIAMGSACALHNGGVELQETAPMGSFGERVRFMSIQPGVTATLVAPAKLDRSRRVDLVLYALPNGNSTAETAGRLRSDSSIGWRYDIQHIAAQARALRQRGYEQLVLVYLEADTKSWPQWRSRQGYDTANARIVAIVNELRAAIGNPSDMRVSLTGHSGGGSFMFGFIEGQERLPAWLDRILFLDAVYNFDARHTGKLVAWLRESPWHRLVSLAYDDRNIMLDGKKVVSDSGGTYRATERMVAQLGTQIPLVADSLGEFRRYRAAQVELLVHPNPQNRILHTEMIGEMNGFMHGMLVGRSAEAGVLLKPARAYTPFVDTVETRPRVKP